MRAVVATTYIETKIIIGILMLNMFNIDGKRIFI